MDASINPAFLLFAALSPILISLLKQSGLPKQANAMIALVCYIVVGILGAILSGEPLTLENAVPLITIATVVGTAAYNLIWSNLGQTTDGDPSFDEALTVKTSLIK